MPEVRTMQTPRVGLYRACLRLLPRSFREEFAEEMVLVFAEQRQRSRGASAMWLWVEALTAIGGLAIRLRADQVRVDLRQAQRGLRRQPTFTLTAVTTLALALGPATAVFTLIDRVLLDPLPRATGLDRVVYIWAANPEQNRHRFPWSELNFHDHRERKQFLSAIAAFASTSATFGGDVPQQVMGAWVSEDMFEVLGVAPARGRRFTTDDMRPGTPLVIVLGHDFARARFGDREPIGQSVIVDGRATEVIGVLPEGLRFPAAEPDFWQPLRIDPANSNRGQTYLNVIGRLADGSTIADVDGHMNRVALDLEQAHPSSNSGSRIEIVPAVEQLTQNARRIISVLGLAAIAIFLLACTNIASLIVVRTAGRQTELSVRTALGASASRLSRQLLIEHLVLAALAAVAAVGIAMALLRILALTRLVPPHQLERVTIGSSSLVFLAALLISTAAVLGWLVSRRATRAAAITSGQRAYSATHEVVRVRQALVGVEVGAAVVLLVAAGLLIQSAARLVSIDPGFRTDRVVTFQVGLPMSRYMEPAARVRFIESVVERLKQVPGVEAAASGAYAPMTSMRATRRFAVDGRPLPAPGTEPLAIDLPASLGYADIMGLRIVEGRWIDERDGIDAPPVVVVTETFVKQHFGGERALGRRLRYYGRPDMPPPPMPEIVGIVSDVRQFGMAEAAIPQMYVPQAQRPWTFTSFFVRTAGDPRSVLSSLPAAVHAIDPERPLERVRMLGDLVDASTADRRALSALLVVAALVALLISAVGVYGVTAASTAARRRELAIRAAIGADRRGLMRLVVGQGLTASVVGVIAGLASGWAASSVLASVLFEVRPRDPATYGAVALLLLAVCWLATYVPARHALSTSPAEALRAE